MLDCMTLIRLPANSTPLYDYACSNINNWCARSLRRDQLYYLDDSSGGILWRSPITNKFRKSSFFNTYPAKSRDIYILFHSSWICYFCELRSLRDVTQTCAHIVSSKHAVWRSTHPTASDITFVTNFTMLFIKSFTCSRMNLAVLSQNVKGRHCLLNVITPQWRSDIHYPWQHFMLEFTSGTLGILEKMKVPTQPRGPLGIWA